MILIRHLLSGFNLLVLVYFVIANGFYTVLMIGAAAGVILHKRRLRFEDFSHIRHSPLAPPVSVILPAYNEEAVIVQSVLALLKTEYPQLEVVVVDDGSTDSTLTRLIEHFRLSRTHRIYRPELPTPRPLCFYASTELPQLLVIRKEHSGKAKTLNVGINAARTPYFCTVDADSVLEPDALLRLMAPVMASPVNTGVSAGIIRILNGCEVEDGVVKKVKLPSRWIERFQVAEYLRTFLLGRVGWDLGGGTLIVSGALAVFHRKTVIECGGFSNATVTEDMELVVRLHKWKAGQRRRLRLSFTSDPVCWTQCPQNVKMLARQRRRWHLGLCQTVWEHRPLMFDPAHGFVGMVSFPFHVLIEGLGALVEALGYVSLPLAFAIHAAYASLYLSLAALCLVYAVFLSVCALALEEVTYRRYDNVPDLIRLIVAAALENLGYRQMVLFFRVQGLVRFLAGLHHWESVTHREHSPSLGATQELNEDRAQL